jgi:hypothetical protein
MAMQPDLAVPVMIVTAKKALIDIKNTPPKSKPPLPLPSSVNFTNALADIAQRKAKLESPDTKLSSC